MLRSALLLLPFYGKMITNKKKKKKKKKGISQMGFRRWFNLGPKITLSGRGRTLTTCCGCHRRLQIVGSRWDFVDEIVRR